MLSFLLDEFEISHLKNKISEIELSAFLGWI